MKTKNEILFQPHAHTTKWDGLKVTHLLYFKVTSVLIHKICKYEPNSTKMVRFCREIDFLFCFLCPYDI